MFSKVKLVELVKSSNREKIEKLAAKGKIVKLNEAHDKAGYTALTCAAMLGEEEILKILLDNGIDANHQDKMGRSALYVASLTNQPKVAKLLIRYEIDYNQKNTPKQQTCIDACKEWGSNETLKVIGDGLGKHLVNSAKKGDLDTVRELVQIPMINLEAPDTTGWTALHYAMKHNNEHMVEVLAAAGADSQYKNMAGSSPIDMAQSNGNLSIIKLYFDTYEGRGRLKRKERDREVEPVKKFGQFVEKPVAADLGDVPKFKHKKITQKEILEMEKETERHRRDSINVVEGDSDFFSSFRKSRSLGDVIERIRSNTIAAPEIFFHNHIHHEKNKDKKKDKHNSSNDRNNNNNNNNNNNVDSNGDQIEIKGGWKHKDIDGDMDDILRKC